MGGRLNAVQTEVWPSQRDVAGRARQPLHGDLEEPKPIADIAHQNKREVYNLLMRASADTVLKIGADPKHLGARVGLISVLHTCAIHR